MNRVNVMKPVGLKCLTRPLAVVVWLTLALPASRVFAQESVLSLLPDDLVAVIQQTERTAFFEAVVKSDFSGESQKDAWLRTQFEYGDNRILQIKSPSEAILLIRAFGIDLQRNVDELIIDAASIASNDALNDDEREREYESLLSNFQNQYISSVRQFVCADEADANYLRIAELKREVQILSDIARRTELVIEQIDSYYQAQLATLEQVIDSKMHLRQVLSRLVESRQSISAMSETLQRKLSLSSDVRIDFQFESTDQLCPSLDVVSTWQGLHNILGAEEDAPLTSNDIARLNEETNELMRAFQEKSEQLLELLDRDVARTKSRRDATIEAIRTSSDDRSTQLVCDVLGDPFVSRSIDQHRDALEATADVIARSSEKFDRLYTEIASFETIGTRAYQSIRRAGYAPVQDIEFDQFMVRLEMMQPVRIDLASLAESTGNSELENRVQQFLAIELAIDLAEKSLLKLAHSYQLLNSPVPPAGPAGRRLIAANIHSNLQEGLNDLASSQQLLYEAVAAAMCEQVIQRELLMTSD